VKELNREANTPSPHSQHVETTRAAVDMKVLIEQMREQVQNVEYRLLPTGRAVTGFGPRAGALPPDPKMQFTAAAGRSK
jgi:hypothetical protein